MIVQHSACHKNGPYYQNTTDLSNYLDRTIN